MARERERERERKRKGDVFLHPRIGAARISDAMTPGGFRIPSRAADARAYVRESRRETTQEKVSTTIQFVVPSLPLPLFRSISLSLFLHFASYRNEVYALHLSVQSGLGKEAYRDRRSPPPSLSLSSSSSLSLRRRRRCCIRRRSR